MKKNLTFKAVSVLAVLTLITSCFAGGTFAKYVTAGEGGDTARGKVWCNRYSKR